MTLSYKNMHVYRRHLRGIFRNVKKTVLKAQFYIAFAGNAIYFWGFKKKLLAF
jgi:hypothetical protein